MGRYYFNIDDGSNIRDTLGMDLPALAAAKCEAVRYASRLICDDAEHFWDAGVFQMTVSDEKGLTILLVEQYLDFCREIADDIYIMDRGEIMHKGPAADLDLPEVRRHLMV